MYTAAVLDPESREKLISKLGPHIPEGFEVIAHHMTINMGPIKPEWESFLGSFGDLLVTEIAFNDKVVAVKIKSDFPSVNKNPHITLAVNRKAGGRPVMSNKLVNWQEIPTPFLLRARVEEIK